jgi:hypothetical protein
LTGEKTKKKTGSATSAFTTAAEAVPITTATARSTTFPPQQELLEVAEQRHEQEPSERSWTAWGRGAVRVISFRLGRPGKGFRIVRPKRTNTFGIASKGNARSPTRSPTRQRCATTSQGRSDAS